jgi:hypothetical protein
VPRDGVGHRSGGTYLGTYLEAPLDYEPAPVYREGSFGTALRWARPGTGPR